METHKVTKSANQGRFLPDTLQGTSKAHNPSNSRRNLQQVHPIKMPPISQAPGNRLGLGEGLGEGQRQRQREHPEDVHPPHRAQAGGERPPSLHHHVPAFRAALGHNRQRDLGRKRNREARTPHTGPPNLAGVAAQGAPPDLALRRRAGKPQGPASLPRGSGRRVARNLSANAQARPTGLPAPFGSAPGRQTAPGANFAWEEEATPRRAGCASARGKERLPVHLPPSKAVSPSLCRASAAPAHLTRAPRRRRGRRDGRYGTRPSLSRRVALGKGAGRAQRAGGGAVPTGRQAVGGPARTGNPLLTSSDRLDLPVPSIRRTGIGRSCLSVKRWAGRGLS